MNCRLLCLGSHVKHQVVCKSVPLGLRVSCFWQQLQQGPLGFWGLHNGRVFAMLL